MARYVWDRKEARWVPAGQPKAPEGLLLINRDAAFADGVRSMADGRVYRSRRAYDDHLKRHGMVEVGDARIGDPRR